MLMISHANTNPGITKAWDPGEPDKYYPTGVRNYGRVIATDDLQGAADAEFAKQDLKVTKCVVLNDAQTYGIGVAQAFTDERRGRHRDRRRGGMGLQAAELHSVCSRATRTRAATASSSVASTTTTVSS